jgi:hypothetical protein
VVLVGRDRYDPLRKSEMRALKDPKHTRARHSHEQSVLVHCIQPLRAVPTAGGPRMAGQQGHSSDDALGWDSTAWSWGDGAHGRKDTGTRPTVCRLLHRLLASAARRRESLRDHTKVSCARPPAQRNELRDLRPRGARPLSHLKGTCYLSRVISKRDVACPLRNPSYRRSVPSESLPMDPPNPRPTNSHQFRTRQSRKLNTPALPHYFTLGPLLTSN